MTLQEKIEAGRFVVTSEIGPPKGIDPGRILKGLELIRGRLDAVNATDLQSSLMRMGSLAACSILKQHGYESVFQLTCRDRNRLALQSDLLSAAALGIRNVLVLTGDHPSLGDHPEAKPVYDLDSVQLLQAAHLLTTGFDMKGHALEGAAPELYLGAVVNPSADPLEPEIIKMEKKIRAGAQFFQTQAVFDPGVFERFLEKTAHLKTALLVGVVLVKSAAMARYMNKHIPGMLVPDDIIDEMERAPDKAAVSVEIAGRIIRRVRPFCNGIHVIPIGWDRYVPRVLDAAGI